ncbi:MAG: LysR family substrate-binding domain-containing protein, partial [Methylibium sp.]
LEGAVREARLGRSGFLLIGAIQSAITDLLPAVMDGMKQSFPALSLSVVEIDSCSAEDALLAGEIDLAFARLDADRGDIRVLPIQRDRVCVALPQGHELAVADAVPLAALATEDMVWFPRSLSPNYFDSLIAACRAAGFSPRIRHEVRGLASQLAFVSCRQGAALVAGEEARRLCPPGAVLRPLQEQVEVVTLAVAWREARADAALEEAVRLATC